jgi:hypothetical protein
MRLRGFPSVLRIHSSKKKEGHEQYFSELMLFYPWRNEIEDLFRCYPEHCIAFYHIKKETIDINRKGMFPCESTMDLLDSDINLEDLRPTHIYETLDSQREQENDDDANVGAIDDPEFATMIYSGDLKEENVVHEEFKYRKICLPNQEELLFLARQLVEEQMRVLTEIVTYCKGIVRARKGIDHPPQLRLIIHGGAGMYIIEGILLMHNC